jgi:hypothetical protein
VVVLERGRCIIEMKGEAVSLVEAESELSCQEAYLTAQALANGVDDHKD